MSALRIGIDLGSTTTKAVVLDASGKIVATALERSEPRAGDQAQRMIAELVRKTGAEGAPVIATGYGRKLVPGASKVVTEITCHARGVFAQLGRAGLLIDMGGQDTKAILVDGTGRVADFAMNDKCAAGTGRFLEVILPRLQAPWDKLRGMYQSAPEAVQVSSTCTVFAESEVISLLANGQAVEGIVRGLHDALAERVVALAGRMLEMSKEVMLSGGVANNGAMVDALGARLGAPVTVVPEPSHVGAIGAALTPP
ncbi:MAG: 2-hydroxyglutaryl-CoA dehydratase [Deltaproteobacteria bacterium]|nr:2-hydroxyglutaryl-CoA dehydratase [Deltaproteobacteria bacterium]